MNIHIDSVTDIAKGMSIKRERSDADRERVIAHLKFQNLLVSREALDELLQQPVGWTRASFFDDLGVPRVAMEVGLPIFKAVVTGVIRGSRESDAITLKQADMQGVTYILVNNGVKISGELVWKCAGDEISDIEPLLGNKCAAKWVIQDAGQGDFLRAA